MIPFKLSATKATAAAAAATTTTTTNVIIIINKNTNAFFAYFHRRGDKKKFTLICSFPLSRLNPIHSKKKIVVDNKTARHKIKEKP